MEHAARCLRLLVGGVRQSQGWMVSGDRRSHSENQLLATRARIPHLFTLNRRATAARMASPIVFLTFIEIDRSYRPKASTEMSKGKKKFDPHASAISQRS